MNKLQCSMSLAREAYHHGDLRESLLEAARAQLEREGPSGLSLRKLGRELGVTPGAPYRHFEDKDALLAALAVEGYRELTALMLEKQEGAADGRERLKRAGEGYLTFATSNPGLFRLMFGWMPSRDIPELCEASDAAFAVHQGVIQSCAEEGLLTRSIQEASLASWAAVHGAAFLLIDERIDVGQPVPDASCLIGYMHDGIWYGIGGQPP